jgi:F-type H+-transporting ATPase subunit alpha
MPVGEQVAILYCGTHALMSDISIDAVPEFQASFLDRMRAGHQDILEALASGKFDENSAKVIEEVAAAVSESLR